MSGDVIVRNPEMSVTPLWETEKQVFNKWKLYESKLYLWVDKE